MTQEAVTPDVAPTGAADADSRSSALTTRWRPGSFALRDAWFPVLHTQTLRRRPVRRAIHGQPVFVFREAGEVVASEDHPYDVARGRTSFTEFTAGTGRYPVAERYGYAWVWYGDPENASPDLLPDVPYLPRAGGLARHRVGSVIFDSTYELINENLLDLTHTDFVHSSLVGDSLSDEDEISVDSTSETVTMIRTAKGRRTPKTQRLLVRSEHQDLRAVTHVHVRSGVCVLHGDFRPGLSVRLLHPNVPESPFRTRTTFTMVTERANKVLRNLFPLVSHLIGSQDNRVLQPQNPLYRGVESEERPDMSSRFDAAGMRFRKVHQELVARQQQGDFTYLPDGDPSRDVAELLDVDRVD